jgi:cytochrome c biogenesis protein CcmG/thiol:disulfide interchange protein DsbE
LNRFVLPVVIFMALAGVLYVGVKHSPDKNDMASALIGRPAPDFELPILGDTMRKLSSKELAGRPWVLNVWGTWCVECRIEHQMLLKIAAEKRVRIVGLSWKDDDAAASQWLQELGNPYSVVAVDKEGRTAIDFGVYGAPETFFIDAQGRVQYRHAGAMTEEVWQREFVARLPAGMGTLQ